MSRDVQSQKIQHRYQRYLGCRRFNPAIVLRTLKTFSQSEAYKDSLMNLKQAKKRREIIFMRFVIASLVTRLNLVESKKLICENCHSALPASEGKARAKHFCDKLYSPKIDLGQIRCRFQSQLFSRRQSEREQINQSFRLHRLDHRCILLFFFWSTLFDFIINYSN